MSNSLIWPQLKLKNIDLQNFPYSFPLAFFIGNIIVPCRVFISNYAPVEAENKIKKEYIASDKMNSPNGTKPIVK